MALAFNILAGFNDGGNLLACAAASRTIQPLAALLIIATGAFLGPLIAGTAVARTIGFGIIDYHMVGAVPLLGGMAGGTLALLTAYGLRVPISASIALVSASIGSVIVTHQLQYVMWPGVAKVAISLAGSIIVGFVAGAIVYTVLVIALRGVSDRTGRRLMRLQYVSVALQAVGYGSNDAEKMVGLIVAASIVNTPSTTFAVPFWAIGLSIGAFVVGMTLGGMRIARTIGTKLFRIGPLHALAFQSAAAATVLTASALGGPLSTTETSASAILGAGAAANPRGLRWQTARKLMFVWLLTVPLGLAAGMLATLFFHALIRGGH